MSFLDEAWAYLYQSCHPFVLTSVGSFAVLIVAWLIFNTKYTLIAHFNLFSKYKLQKAQVPTDTVWKHFRSSLLEQFIVTLPLFLVGYFFFKWFNIHAGPDLPTLGTVVRQFLLFNVIEDTLFYWIHRLFHIPYLYKNFHVVHHKFEAPFSIVGGIAHPIEVLFNFTLPIIAGPFILGPIEGVHVTVLWIWLFFREMRSTEAHSGYHLPWHMSRLLWLVGYMGSPMHDVHHMRKGVKYNFGSFLFWDYLCGTYRTASQLESDTK